MSNYGIKEFELQPVNFFAGDFPTLAETGTAAVNLSAREPVVLDDNGKLAKLTKAAADKVIGIVAEDAGKDEPAVYYMTGEFFADALVLPDGVTAEDIKLPLRKLSIFLR